MKRYKRINERLEKINIDRFCRERERESNYPAEYDVCLSLGSNCWTSKLLRACLFQNASYPFDWIRSIDENMAIVLGLEDKIDLLCNDFKNWMNFEDFFVINDNANHLEKKHQNVKNTRTGLQYLHDFPIGFDIKETFPAIKEKYTRRAQRLTELLNSDKKVALVFYAGLKFLNTDIIERCFNKLEQKFPTGKFDLLVLQNNPYMKSRDLFIETLTPRCKVCHFKNGDFSWDIQGSYEKISKRCTDVLNILIKKQNTTITSHVLHYKMIKDGVITSPEADYTGVISWGPASYLKTGCYEITINYDLTEGAEAYFDLCHGKGRNVWYHENLSATQHQVTIWLNTRKDVFSFEIRTFLTKRSQNQEYDFKLYDIKIHTLSEQDLRQKITGKHRYKATTGKIYSDYKDFAQQWKPPLLRKLFKIK